MIREKEGIRTFQRGWGIRLVTRRRSFGLLQITAVILRQEVHLFQLAKKNLV